MNRLNDFFGRNAVRLLGVLFLVSLLTPRHFASGETVRFAGDSDLVGENGRWTREVAEEWAKKTNNTVEYISRPADATATLQLYLQYWGSKSADVDVYMVDVIWQGNHRFRHCLRLFSSARQPRSGRNDQHPRGRASDFGEHP